MTTTSRGVLFSLAVSAVVLTAVSSSSRAADEPTRSQRAAAAVKQALRESLESEPELSEDVSERDDRESDDAQRLDLKAPASAREGKQATKNVERGADEKKNRKNAGKGKKGAGRGKKGASSGKVDHKKIDESDHKKGSLKRDENSDKEPPFYLELERAARRAEPSVVQGLVSSRRFARRLPPRWSGVEPTDDQREEIYRIQEAYFQEIVQLEVRMERLKRERDVAMLQVLEPRQRAKLSELEEEASKREDSEPVELILDDE